MKANEVFNCLCMLISDKYKDDGWKYSKSSHCMTKKDKKFMYKVFFYTSWNNISNKHVAFYGECAIIPVKSKNKVFNINTRQCNIPNGSLEWNIASEKDLEQVFKEFTDWLDKGFMTIVDGCTNHLEDFVEKVVLTGFYPRNGYVIDISFVLDNGSRELAEEAAKRYYKSLDDYEKMNFKENYESMINGNEAVNNYGRNMMLNYSNFKTIIENKIIVTL